MAFDLRPLFASNVFTRAQVVVLHGLARALRSEGGTYTPTLTNVTNMTASSGLLSMWRRTGPHISVTVCFTADPNAASTAGEVEFTLPVDPGANFAADTDLLGTAYSGTAFLGGHFIAKTGARKARLLVAGGTDVASRTWVGTFFYPVSP